MNIPLVAQRALAYMIDIVLLFVTLATLVIIMARMTGLMPETHSQVWVATVLSFSIPAWLYFTLSDHSRLGATLGKRLLKLRVVTISKDQLSLGRSLARTAVKLMPWELAHIFGFALAGQLGSVGQSAGLIAANGLILIYLIVALVTRGKRSIHDLVVGTEVGQSVLG